MRNLPWSVASLLPLLLGSVPAQAQCSEWVPKFVTQSGGVDGQVRAQAVFDDGSGPALFLGGYFGNTAHGAVDAPTTFLARWNGARFDSLAGGSPNAAVTSLVLFDDGSGPALVAGGLFSSVGGSAALRVARWNGSSWSALGAGLDANVFALAVFDDGSGPALYAGGDFSNSGATPVHGIARWNGSTWTSLGSGINGNVRALRVFDDGTGAALYVGGLFSAAGGTAASNLARWDGTSWSPLGAGTDGVVLALAVHDDGNGPALYAGGSFSSAGASPALHIARWSGSAWSALGGGTDADVFSLLSCDLGTGTELVAGGNFNHAGAVVASGIAAWDGASWTSLSGSSDGGVTSLGLFDAGAGPHLHAGGAFTNLAGRAADRIAEFVDGAWRPLGAGEPPNGSVLALATLDRGDGPRLYAAGAFTKVGALDANRIASWNGTGWSALGSGLDGTADVLALFDDGSGTALCVGGSFQNAGGVLANGVARWDGASWSAFGSGFPGGNVESLAVYDDGSGPALYAGGNAITVGGVRCVAKWNGSTWEVVGGALTYYSNPPQVQALKVWDDGNGPALYAAGAFDTIAGLTVNNIARWDGTSWSALGTGTFGSFAYGLEVFDDGSGEQLYAAGYFFQAGGIHTGHVARWNGTQWSSLTPSPVINNTVYAIHAFDDGTTRALYVGGLGFNFGGALTNLARWDGAGWTGLGANGQEVHALASYDDGSGRGRSLFVGRQYLSQGYYNPHYLSQQASCPASIASFCFGDGGQLACPCANSGAAGRGCENSLQTGGALLGGSGATQPDSVVMTTSGMPATALTVFLQGTQNLWPGVIFGDGVRCVGGNLKRLYSRIASGGVVAVPGPGDASISARSASLGFPIAPGTQLYYQMRYRDPNPGFCPAPPGNTWNVSNGVVVRW